MIRSLYLLFASIILTTCAPHPSSATQAVATGRIHLGHDPVVRPVGERLAFQFNDGSVFIQVSDGRGGPPIQYRGEALSVERVKNVRRLTAAEVRERFGDQTLVGGFLIEIR
jgi:hypothetical protein